MKLPIITDSQMRMFRRCPKEHLFAYVLGFRPVDTAEALRFGTLVHLALEAWWRERDPSKRLSAAIEAMRGQAADDFELVRAGVMMQGYDARWGDEPYDVLAVEGEFQAPLRNPETGMPSRTFALGGKLDVVVRDQRDGRIKIVEHKTSSDEIGPGSDYWRCLSMDSQVSTYFAGSRALGFEIEECIYDVLGKPQLRPKGVPVTDEHGAKIVLDKNGERVRTQRGKWRETGDAAQGYELQTRPETPDEFHQRLLEHVSEKPDRYYHRGKVVRLESEEADAAYDAWHTARLIREAELANRWPRNASSCRRYNRLCSYFDVCSGATTLEDESRFRKVERVHEELSFEAA